MPDAVDKIDYQKLAYTELEKASKSTDPDRRHAHLNQASIFATLSEQQRHGSNAGESETAQN